MSGGCGKRPLTPSASETGADRSRSPSDDYCVSHSLKSNKETSLPNRLAEPNLDP